MGTLTQDRVYIANKYHKQDEPFNPYRRMQYHGWECDPATGLDDDAMKAGLQALLPSLEGLPHPVYKAKCFAYVLENMRFAADEHDWFVCLYNWGRVLTPVTVKAWKREIFDAIPELNAQKELFDRTGASAIWPDFDHVIPDWDSLLALGFPGLLERVRRYHRQRENLTAPEDAFFAGMELTYEAVLSLLKRLADYAEAQTHEKAARQARCLRQLSQGAPRDLYEALQAMYLFFLLCECVDHFQTRSLGNGFDSTLRPFFERDLASGVYTRQELEDFIAYFLLQYDAIGNYWGHPMYLGGTNPDGSCKVSAFTDTVLDIYDRLGIFNPKIQVKVDENTPKAFVLRVLDLVRRGRTSFVFCGEPGLRRAVKSYGATEEEALSAELSGCYETRIRGKESSAVSGYVNAAKAVELAFFRGVDQKTGLPVGPVTPDVEEMGSFEEFYAAFMTQWDFLVERTMIIADGFEGRLHEINPSNMYSATVEESLRRGKDGYALGVKYNNSAVLNCGFATAVDSLLAVRELVFEKKIATLPELKQALEDNWEGYARLRTQARRCAKYGNGLPQSDALAAKLAEWFSAKVNGRPNARGGVYKASMHTAMQFVWQGAKTWATPDGRFAGDHITKNASPSDGMDRSGVTALVSSACALVPSDYWESFCVDMMLHPATVAGEEGLEAMYALLMTYVRQEGMAMQFNIFDSETLKDAQAHPENYRGLQVRVCGWNALWNDLSRQEQDAYIRRAEGIC